MLDSEIALRLWLGSKTVTVCTMPEWLPAWPVFIAICDPIGD